MGNSDPNDDPDFMSYDEVKGGDYLVDQDAAHGITLCSSFIIDSTITVIDMDGA